MMPNHAFASGRADKRCLVCIRGGALLNADV